MIDKFFNHHYLFSRLATFIAGYELFQIEVNKTYGVASWRTDLKKVGTDYLTYKIIYLSN